MIYGRVIGNELRDVPPECLPVWGQRWSGYRVPHGPSPFSTRIFSVDRMSEMGPALTSPTQFEVTLAEEDEAEDASSESSRLCGSFSPYQLAIQADTTELTSQTETLTPRSIHHSSGHSHGSPEILNRNTGHSPPQNSTCSRTMLFPRRQSEHPITQPHTSEPLFQTPTPYHGIQIQGGHGSFENDYTLWNMDHTPASMQSQTGPSHGSHVPSGQIWDTMPLYPVPEWQFADPHAQSSAYPFQPNPWSHPDSSFILQPFQADGRARFIPAPPPSSSHRAAVPLPQQSVGIVHSQSPMIAQWPSGSVAPNSSFRESLQNSRSSLGPGMTYRFVSDDHRNSSHSEDSLATFAHAEGCTLLSPDTR